MRQVLCPQLIGREDELEVILAAIGGVRAKQGAAIFLVGEAGVGKSRLAREADAAARRQGLRVLWGRSVEGGATAAYRPVSEALLSAFRDGAPRDDIAELRPFRPILGRLIPDWRDDAASPADDSLVLLSEAVLRLLRVLAGESGCLLILEDLHWADAETLAVVEYLASNLYGARVTLLATVRSGEANAALTLARSLSGHRTGNLLDVHRLDEGQIDLMARSCLGGSDLPSPIEHLLRSSADGLPLLVEDLLAEWQAAGALIREDDRWLVRHVVGPVVPISFGEIVRRRLATLGPEAERLLQTAALLGRRFDWTLLAPAVGLDEPQVLDVLHAAVDAQLLTAEDTGFRFRHALTQAAVVERLLPPRRSRLAAQLVELLEHQRPGLPGELCQLAAGLAEMAGDSIRAAGLLLQAGRRSLAAGALATAETTLDRARDLRPGDPALGLVIDELLLDVLAQAGKHERVVAAGEALLEDLAGASVPDQRRAEVHAHIARALLAAGRWSEMESHVERARLLAPDRPEVLARLDAFAAHAALDQDQPEEAERLARAALGAAEASLAAGGSGTSREFTPALSAGGTAMAEVACEALEVIGRRARLFDLIQAEAAFERARQIAEEHHLTVWQLRAMHELGTIDMFRDQSFARLRQARDLAEQCGALATGAMVDVQLAALHQMRFELADTFRLAERAIETASRLQLHMTHAVALLFQADFWSLRQDRSGMEAVIAEAVRLSHHDPVIELSCWGDCRANASLMEENRPRAVRELETSQEWARKVKVSGPSPSHGMWALLLTIQGGGDAACDEVRASAAMIQPANVGLLSYADAIRLGRQGAAGEAMAAVHRGDEIMRNMPWFKHYGRRLAAEAAIADGWGEPATWLSEAAGFFADNGNEAVVSACRSLLRKAGVSSARAHPDVPTRFRKEGVTDREMEVLNLVAEGLSNKQIGERLYLSPRTVEKHIASLMDKLNVRTRAQLAALTVANMGDGSTKPG